MHCFPKVIKDQEKKHILMLESSESDRVGAFWLRLTLIIKTFSNHWNLLSSNKSIKDKPLQVYTGVSSGMNEFWMSCFLCRILTLTDHWAITWSISLFFRHDTSKCLLWNKHCLIYEGLHSPSAETWWCFPSDWEDFLFHWWMDSSFQLHAIWCTYWPELFRFLTFICDLRFLCCR